MTKRCDTCENYESAYGQCRLNPPVVMLMPSQGDYGMPYAQTFWPNVQINDWCGRWTPRAPEGF